MKTLRLTTEDLNLEGIQRLKEGKKLDPGCFAKPIEEFFQAHKVVFTDAAGETTVFKDSVPPEEPQQGAEPAKPDESADWPAEWISALKSLYEKYGSAQTNAQKINILTLEVGDCCVSYIGMSKDTPKDHERMKLRVMELDYLEKLGLHQPHYC